MGATDFFVTAKGKNAKEAFRTAREEALHEHGHGRYTGSIAEKIEFVMITLPAGVTAGKYANDLLDNDPRISDKWGPAGCIDLGNGEFLFFGLAST